MLVSMMIQTMRFNTDINIDIVIYEYPIENTFLTGFTFKYAFCNFVH